MATAHANQEAGARLHVKALVAMTFVSLSSFQYGLDFGVIGGLQAMVGFLKVFGTPPTEALPKWNISSERQQLISSLMVLGAFISSSSAGFTSRWVGRRLSLWIACALVFVSTAIMQATVDIGGLYAGRLILGLANGLLMTHAQLYITEVVAARYRGLGISAFTLWVALGSFVGNLVDYGTAERPDRSSYIIPLGTVHIVPGILFIALFFLPESPRWLAARGQTAQAEKSLTWLRPGPAHWSVAEELAEMEAALAAEAQLQSSIGLLDLVRNPIDRRRTTIAVLGLTTQAASGAMFLISYGTYFFSMADVGDAFTNSCILTGVGVAGLVLSNLVITRWGYRRPMMMAGFALCGLAQLIIAVVYTVEPGTEKTGKVIVGVSVLYIVAYNGLISPYAWLSGGELSSQRLRSYTFGIATAIGFFGAWLTTFTAPYFINPDSLNWGPKYGYIWAPSCFITMVWIYFYLPEAKDRTLEQIDEMFEARVPARKFRGYKCTGAHAALEKEKEAEMPNATHEEGDGSPSTTKQHVVSDAKA
ncbi:general substrate transporter [Apiospora marii]|uniref:general substrate transporter n=1 Tax=Apiospora marii TaxID=335849 RepID=UPI00312FDA65